MKRYIIFLLCGLFLFPVAISAKEGPDTLSQPKTFLSKNFSGITQSFGLSKFADSKPKKNWFKGMRYSGWARFYPFYRNMKDYYDIPAVEQGLTLPINITANDGYQQPLMLFKLEGNPSAKTSFQMELQFDHFLKRTALLTQDTLGHLANLYVLFNFQGAVETSVGKFRMIAGGGVNWYRLSPFTLWGYQYRDDMFERYPWDPEGHDFGRYNSFYSLGDIPRDQRFGMQGTQGFILEGTGLPAGFDAAILYGKNTSSGGFQSFLTKDPQNMIASRVGKTIGDHKIGYNYFNQFGFLDGKVDYKKYYQGTDSSQIYYVQDNFIGQIVTTVDGRFNFRRISFFAEAGIGSYLSNTYNDGLRDNIKAGVDNVSRYKREWDETAIFEITTKKELTRLPLKFSFYRIGARVINNTSAVSNTSIEQAKPTTSTPDEYYTNYFDGMVTEIGQLANNRQGLNFFTTKNFNKLTTKLAVGIAQEIENLAGDIRNGARAGSTDSLTRVPYTNSISFEHRLNGLTRSRFGFYKRFTGPYSRLHSIFRRTYENIAITDTEIDYKKSFSTIDLELKYKIRLFNRELILSSFTNFSSVQDKWSPIPVFTDKAFVRIFYEELMAFYAVHPKVTLVGFVGTERVLGNKRTELANENGDLITDGNGRPVADPNGKTINQTGYGVGVGTDYNFHSRASLHLRHRWFTHEDKNFTRDKFRGNEMTVEFKVFF